MKKRTFDSQSGMSIIEILIILVITAILTTFAIAQLGQSKTNFQRQNVARELKVSLERARFDSVKRRASDTVKRASVKVNATTFDVTIDLNTNGTIETSDTRQISFGTGSSDIRIVSSDLSFPVTVTFDQRGQIVATDSAGKNVTPKFIICNGCTAETATPQNANVVSISPTGTIVMTPFGEADPTFQNPVVTNVNTNSGIKDTVAFLPNSNTSTGGSPTPTLTPTPTPTPSPDASPTATQTPPPTPTQAPPPTACLRNQRPAQDNCVCNSPMFIRSNGKCQ